MIFGFISVYELLGVLCLQSKKNAAQKSHDIREKNVDVVIAIKRNKHSLVKLHFKTVIGIPP